MAQRWVGALAVGLGAILLGFCLFEELVAPGVERTTTASEQALPAARVVWEYPDPVGDDYGPGQYTYPTHSSFASPGLFDLTRLVIWDWGDQWLVDVELVEGKAAWSTPEGFLHQLIDIYFDVIPGSGIAEPMIVNGPQVRFAPNFAWEYRIKLAPWSKSALYASEGVSSPIAPWLLPDGRTIRASIDKKLLQGLSPGISVIAWVGGYHSLGPDHYRVVAPKESTWRFGGGEEVSSFTPNIIDLLAPPEGPLTQERQLAARTAGQMAMVHPVTMPLKGWQPSMSQALMYSVPMLVLAGLLVHNWVKRRAKSQ